MVRLQIKLENESYTIVEFIKKHNHEPTPQDKMHLLRSQRKIQLSQAGLIDSMHSVGIISTEIFSLPSTEAGGSRNLNFIQEVMITMCKERALYDLKKVMHSFFWST